MKKHERIGNQITPPHLCVYFLGFLPTNKPIIYNNLVDIFISYIDINVTFTCSRILEHYPYYDEIKSPLDKEPANEET